MAITSKDMLRMVRRMRIAKGDIVLVKNGTDLAEGEVLKRFLDVLKKSGRTDVVVITVNDFEDLKTIPENEMAKHGWLKRSKIQSLVLRKVKPPERPEESDD